MSDATNSTSSDNQATGYKVVNYTLQCLAWGCSVAVAFSCSSIIMGIVMFIIMSIVMALLCALINIVVYLKVDASTVESLGRTVNATTSRVRGMFTRTPAAA